MGTRRFSDPLAQADPFELSQAIAAAVHAMPGAAVRDAIARACVRASAYYREELQALLDPNLDDEVVKTHLVAFFRCNLRAIRFFGPAFARDVEARLPADRAVGIDAEPMGRPRRVPATAVGLAAIALLAAGLGGAGAFGRYHFAAAASAPPIALASPPPPREPGPRPLAASTGTPSPSPSPVPSATPTPTAAPATAQPSPVPPMPPPDRPPATPHASPAPPPGHGAVAVVLTPAPTPTAISVSDLPRTYSDATPIPQQSLAPAVAPPAPRVPKVTPSPSPRPNWLTRTALHLDPFKAGR